MCVCVCLCLQLLQQRAEVAGALRLLCGGVGALRNHTALTQCQKSVLSRLDHHLRNHLLIVSQLDIQVCVMLYNINKALVKPGVI